MSTWDDATLGAATAPDEVQVITSRHDGTLRRPRTIWIVAVGDRAFVRSTNGREAAWFRNAVATGAGRLVAESRSYDVTFREADPQELPAIDAGYWDKYGRYASIVDHLVSKSPRAATLELRPA
jgi:hypothetical protein